MKKVNIRDFIQPISRYDNLLSFSEIEVPIVDNLVDYFGVNNELATWVGDYYVSRMKDYSALEYHIIPMETTDIVADDFHKIVKAFLMALQRHTTILNLFSIAENKLVLENLLPSVTETVSSSSRNSGTLESRTTYGKTINKTSNSMAENAPIDADIQTISSPNIKGISSDVDTHGGIDVELSTDTRGKTDNSSRTFISPENYEKFVEVLRDLNLPTLIDDLIRRFIWEYNRTI